MSNRFKDTTHELSVLEGTKVWKPNPGRQEQFLSLPDSIPEAFYGGALGGGKTQVLLMYPIARGWFKHPRFNGIIFRRTFPEVEKTLIPAAKEWYPLVGGKYNQTLHQWTFPSGAVIHLGYLDILDDVRRHDGAEYNFIGFDELEHFLRDQYMLLMARCRSKVKELPKIVRSTGMPGGVGHSWVRERFVEPDKLGGKIIVDKLTGNKRIFIPAKLTDNPKLTEGDPDYKNKLRNLSIVEQKAKIDGDWWAYLGQVFNEFRTVRFSDEPENACHVIDPFPIPEWWPKVASIDWGYEHATAIYKFAISPDNRVFIYYEQISKNEYIQTWASNFKRQSQAEIFSDMVMDPSAWAHRGDQKTIAEQFAEASGFFPNKADNDRIGGKMLFHEYLRWTPRPPKYVPAGGYDSNIAMRVLRLHGNKAYQEYEQMFLPDPPETNIPKVQIFKTCTELIKCIPSLIYEDARDGKKAEDVQKMDGDDPYDSVRYGFKACEAFMNLSSEEAAKRKKLGEILHDVEMDHNQTAFYRRMEMFESQQRRKSFGVRLFN